MLKVNSLQQFEDFLKTRVPTRDALFMGDIGLKRAKYFMKLLGNPQNKLKVIHIAGTSGKGSTAYLTSHVLQSQGFKVGLSISPHIFDIRERMQVFCSTTASQTATTNGGHANALLSEKLILKYFNQILPAIRKMESCKYGAPTFFEINVGLAFFMFAKEKIDYAVMETGLGGTLDATNTVSSKNKICIITKIGLDHTEILGKTIAKIAEQKAGIIGKQNTTINIQQSARAQKIIKERCIDKKSQLFTIKQEKNYYTTSSTPIKTVFDFNFKSPNCHPELVSGSIKMRNQRGILKQVQNEKSLILKKVRLGLIGKHQAENCSLALACLAIASERDDFNINEKALRFSLESISIPGRMEIRKIEKQNVIIDGAHNPQKMEAFTTNLAAIYPNQKFTFLVAFKKSKDFKNILKKIIPLADKILLTNFSTSGMDNHWSSVDNKEIATFLESQNFRNFSVIPNNYSQIIKSIKESKKPVAITGSLYFIGSVFHYLKK